MKITLAQLNPVIGSFDENLEKMETTLKQVYDERSQPPALVLLPFEIDDQMLLSERLSELLGTKSRLFVPQRGDGKDLINMASANAGTRFRATAD